MTAEGLSLSPSQIIRINDAGLNLERVKGGSSPFACPRSVVVGGVVLHEPTVQAIEWLDMIEDEYTSVDWSDSASISICAFALFHATQKGFFDRPEMQDVEQIRERVTAFRRRLPATYAQIEQAVEYLARSDETDEKPKKEDGDEYPEEIGEQEKSDRIYSAVAEAISRGLSADDVRTLTRRNLYKVLERNWRDRHGSFDHMDTSALGEFYDTVDSVRKELTSGAKN